MDDTFLPKSVGSNTLAPVQLSEDQEELCRRLDAFYASALKATDVRPSDRLRGALFIMRSELRRNPDWIAQAAHSLREILYPFDKGSSRNSAIEEYGSIYKKGVREREVGTYTNLLDDIAHHNFQSLGKSSLFIGNDGKPVVFSENIFEKFVSGFQKVLFSVLRRQLDAHKEIDALLKSGPSLANPEKVKEYIELNPDAKQYFYTSADEEWLEYLLSNSFLEGIKEIPDDLTVYGYRSVEITYLANIAPRAPEKITDVILSVMSGPQAFNPEVIDRFLSISAHLPVAQIARIAPKIQKEEWSRLMARFEHWGFEYRKLLEKLNDAKDYRSLLLIAEDVLAIVKKEEKAKTGEGRSHYPFCFNSISDSEVFKYLADINEEHLEDALRLAVKIMSEIMLLGEANDESEYIFAIKDSFYLYSIDFFEIELGKERRISERDDVQELAALIKALALRLMSQKCSEQDKVRRLYECYFAQLPDTASMYRLRIFIISLCPNAFKPEIKSTLFRIFDYEKPWSLISGAEYGRLVKTSFSVLNEDERREYISEVIQLFKKDEGTKNSGRRILSCAYSFLTSDERRLAEESLGTLEEGYIPESSIKVGRSGMVVAQAPGGDESWARPLSQIIDSLKSEWSPQVLKETYKNSDDYDFLRPTNAEGVGDRLRKEIESKLTDYLNNAQSFFNRENLHPHYTYNYLRGVSELLRVDKIPAGTNLSDILGLMIAIQRSGTAQPFKEVENKRDDSGWLGSWNAVHSSMADLLKEILEGEHGKLLVEFTENREILFGLVQYLLWHQDPEVKDEQIETAKSRTKSPKDEDYVVTDPYTNAINSVRGKAFQAFVAFIFHDGKRLEAAQDPRKIDQDVQALYETVLKKETTRALMFLFGHHIATIYYRDVDWLHQMLPLIFSADPAKEHLYLAALEGYLTNNLYREVFFDPKIQETYAQAIVQPPMKDNRKYFRDPDDGLATHLALAFIYLYETFGLDHSLFKLFWQHSNDDAKGEFIGFFGRSFVSGRNENADTFLSEHPELLEKMKAFWDWALENCSNPEPLSQFDYWMNPEKQLFELKWLAEQVRKTLEKASGGIDWDYGLTRHIVEMAKVAPGDTLEILRLHILEGGVRKGGQRGMYLQDEWIEALRVLHNTHETQPATIKLIDDLIREGGSRFWKLKEILK